MTLLLDLLADLPAEQQSLAPGKVLFYEGDAPDRLYRLDQGRCSLSYGGEARGEITAPSLVDPTATLGGLPHSVKVTASEPCLLSAWSMDILITRPDFNQAARRYLAEQAQLARTRLNEIAAPIHYQPNLARLIPGPFIFEETTLLIAFCEADRAAVEATLPPGLSLLQRPGRSQAPVFIGLAKFPKAHYEHSPHQRFAYAETTYFIPVREGTHWGMFIPYIYPSSWEPILLGQEIYGFPKRLGETLFQPNQAMLRVDGQDYLDLQWGGSEIVSETRLVRALSDWLGFEGRLTSVAFQAGEVLRKIGRLPAHRRLDVYNHKRLLAVEAEHHRLTYAVDQLTRAAFGVLRWYQIARLDGVILAVRGGPFAGANLTLREAYRTQLDMRLSVGRVVRDYLTSTLSSK